MTVSCTVTGSGLGSAREVLWEVEVKNGGVKGPTTDGIAVGGPVKGKMTDSTEGTLLVEEEVASGEEVVPRGPPGKGWVLTA